MVKRSFIPGSEWLYLKLYTGVVSADRILIQWLQPFYEQIRKKQLVTKMFFLRYKDPDFHLRIRFLVANSDNYQQIIKKMSESLQHFMDVRIVWKVEIGTYEREIERYGGANIEIMESVFACDSLYIIKSLTLPVPDRWQLACLYIEQLFDVLQFSREKRLAILNELQFAFRKEMGLLDVTNSHKLDKKYRLIRSRMESIVTQKVEDDHYMALSEILTHDVAERVENNVSDIIHLINNRIFVSFPRQNEAVLYYFLYKTYYSLNARRDETFH